MSPPTAARVPSSRYALVSKGVSTLVRAVNAEAGEHPPVVFRQRSRMLYADGPQLGAVEMTRSDSSSQTYHEDFYVWTREQAAALRRCAERLPTDVDIEHCAEEIEDLGKRDLREVKSYLRLLLFHLLKIAASPDDPSVPHWRSEAREFGRAAGRAFSPGMRRMIDVAALWPEAGQRLNEDRRDAGLSTLTIGECPFSLGDLLSTSFDLDDALSRIKSGPDGATAGL